MDQAYVEYLKNLLSKARQHVDENSANVLNDSNKAAQLELAKLHNPAYEPTAEELAAQQAVMDRNAGVVSGSLGMVGAAPKFASVASKVLPEIKTAAALKEATPIIGDTLAKEAAAKQLSDQIADNAALGAEHGIAHAPTQMDIAKATALRNRQMDFAQRSNNAYQSKMDAIRKLQGQ